MATAGNASWCSHRFSKATDSTSPGSRSRTRDGDITPCVCPPEAYLQIVAATNYKQRVRKMTEYYHADRLKYAVAGTPNRLEHDQGFFVKQGDGSPT